ncbi:hypothetical protein GCM10009117_00130 [Gangjinia marincola]|uniref:VCBS repeat-containing protein n=1 Tax=Gangjinia marincola TaxID=578463 RepID=A0ABP3XNH3_9FLAO
MRRIFIFTIALFHFVSLCSQKKHINDSFNYQIREALGDINNDGIADKAEISMDTLHETRPLKLNVFVSQPDGTSILFFSGTDMIQAMYPQELNGEYNGNQIPNVSIEGGKLQLEFYVKGNALYEFIYTNGVFELIHFKYVNWDGRNITETTFNLLTGKYVSQSEIHETSEVTQTINAKIIINPLPVLKNFKPFQYNLF